MGRILTNGWKLEYNPEIPEGEQTLSAQYNISVSSMVLVSPDGKATPRIFYKRNSCCLLGRISVVGNGRTHVPEGTRWTGTGRRWTETGQGYGNARSSTDSRTAVAKLLLGGVGQNSEWANGRSWKTEPLSLCTKEQLLWIRRMLFPDGSTGQP